MKKNMGDIDRIIRLAVAIVFAAVYFSGVLKGVVGLVMLIVGIVFFLTSLVGFCPLYVLLGIDTCETRH